MNQNFTIYESFQIKSASPGSTGLMIMKTLIKVRRKGLTFAWLPFTFRYQNTSAQPLILLNIFSNSSTLVSFNSKNWRTQYIVTESVFTIPCLESGSNFTNVLSFCGCRFTCNYNEYCYISVGDILKNFYKLTLTDIAIGKVGYFFPFYILSEVTL